MDRMLNPALDVADDPSGIALVPGPVERLGGDAELDDQIVAEVRRLGLAALFLPQPDQRRFVSAHDIRASEPPMKRRQSMFSWQHSACSLTSSRRKYSRRSTSSIIYTIALTLHSLAKRAAAGSVDPQRDLMSVHET